MLWLTGLWNHILHGSVCRRTTRTFSYVYYWPFDLEKAFSETSSTIVFRRGDMEYHLRAPKETFYTREALKNFPSFEICIYRCIREVISWKMLTFLFILLELSRVIFLKMIFVFEGRKPYKSLDSSTVHPLLNTYLDSNYFSTLSLLHLYCGCGLLFRSSLRPDLVCDSSCSPYVTEPTPWLRKYIHATASH